MVENVGNGVLRLGRNLGLGSWFARFWSSPQRPGSGVGGVEGSDDSNVEQQNRVEQDSSSANVPVAEGSTPFAVASHSAVIDIQPCNNWPSAESSTARETAAGQSDIEAFRRGTDLNSSGSSNNQEKLCLICLEPLSPEDFESEAAMVLQCQCKGNAALRHRECAQKWVDIKGDLICDICRAPIGNLNAPQQRSDNDPRQIMDEQGEANRGGYPSATDVFDCIRMTWVVTIVCILFFHIEYTRALAAGLVLAIVYTWSCQFIRCFQCGGRYEDEIQDETVEATNEPNRPVIVHPIVVV